MKVRSVFDGFVGFGGGQVLLRGGVEYEVGHPLVVARPDLFTEPPAPEVPELVVELEPQAEAEPPKRARAPRPKPKAADE